MTKFLLGFLTVLALASHSSAAIIEVNLTVSLSSVDYSVQAIDDQQLYLSVVAPSFFVANGDTVRVKWTFANSETFQLLPDPHIGLQGWLVIANNSTPIYSYQMVPSWSFLDRNESAVLSGAEQRQGNQGGDLRSGGLTVSNASTIDVGGVLMDLSDIVYTNVDGPLEYIGARFLIHNAAFGAPFDTVPPEQSVPEPATLALLCIAIAGLGVTRHRKLA